MNLIICKRSLPDRKKGGWGGGGAKKTPTCTVEINQADFLFTVMQTFATVLLKLDLYQTSGPPLSMAHA